AMSVAERDPNAAKTAALEAHKLAPDLTPAAIAAARALFRLGDLKRGAKVLERAWTEEPHPDLAAAYVNARPGDSVTDRLKRAKALQALRPNHVESSLAVAHAALDARDLALARDEAVAASRMSPRESIYLLLADIEEAETGSEGRMREWLGRAIRAPRDPAWTADGYVSETWAPVSPVTGRLDAFRWKIPAQRIGGDGAVIESTVEDEPTAISAAEPMAARPEHASTAASAAASAPIAATSVGTASTVTRLPEAGGEASTHGGSSHGSSEGAANDQTATIVPNAGVGAQESRLRLF
ncbi:MAG: heme biosynthesis protein HemY, partial [Rhizobiaceae bacterium]|nr:heme biosynthesis protein HemY [Rhizobiaceae bacterium]